MSLTTNFKPDSPRPATSVPELPTAVVLGIPIVLGDYDSVMDWMDAVIRTRGRVCVTAAAVHLVMVAREDAAVFDAVQRATTVPDGQPLVWALRALGHREASRVYGPDLMARYCERAASHTGMRMFLYGGRDDRALQKLIDALRGRFPGLDIVGAYSPPYRELTDTERDAVAEHINESGADVVWVGTGQPKQEKWMAGMRERLAAPVLVGVGAAFDFHAGIIPQAPSWMQRFGLEWVFRLAQEPRRLWRRYARYNPRFVAAFVREYAARGRS
jgi:N-acetylglucosaminyldiphosphoundecaprenol N-acetyl-beta-D-mannosaminyltransferase